jgi:hypothetical protein
MTLLYEFWYDMVLGGTYTQVITKMHETYGESQRIVKSLEATLTALHFSGPIMRVGPEELHCNDAAFVDEIYAAGGRERNKQAHNLGVLAGPTTKSAFSIIDYDLYRVRCNAMNKFFTRA